MEQWEREIHTHRILSGKTVVSLPEGTWTMAPPSIEDRLRAAEHYAELLEEARLDGLLGEAEALDLLRRRRIWTPEDERQLGLLTEKIDDLKVGLFENWTHSNHRFLIRQALAKGKEEMARLEGIRHCLDHVTCEGYAAAGRVRFLTLIPLPQDAEFYLDDIIESLVKTRLVEPDVRELVRNDPWRSYWAARKLAARGLLDVAAVDLTDEQRYTMMWANVYDNIRESGDCPDDSIVEDDDMLDGWMIKQRRERQSQQARKRGDEIVSPRMKNADEIFVVADTVDDARQIDRLNDGVAKTIKAQRLAHLRSKGTVPELEMPDTWARLQSAAAKAASDRIMGRA